MNGFARKQYHRQKKELFPLYEVILSLIYKFDKDPEENSSIFEDNLMNDRSPRSINITFIRTELYKCYHKNDRTGFLNTLNVKDTVKTLEEIGIISIKKGGKQERVIQLNPLGKDLKIFIDILNYYSESYFDLFNSFTQKMLFIPSSHLDLINMPINQLNSIQSKIRDGIKDYRFKLLENGWTKDEISSYNDIRTNLIDLKIVCDKNFFHMILLRCAKIIKKYEIKHHLLLEFFSYLIKEHNNKKIDFILSNYETEINGYSRIKVESPINLNLVRNIDKMQVGMDDEEKIFLNFNEDIVNWGASSIEYQYFVDIYNIFYDTVISFSFENKIKDMVISYVELLGVHLGEYDRDVDGLRDRIEKTKEELHSNPRLNNYQKNKINLIIRTMELFLNILLDYAERKNMHMTLFL